MANTVFFKKAFENVSTITWGDVFSDFRKQHSKEDFDYALLAGTSLDKATEDNMLHKWRKPWIFYPILKGGVALIIFIYLLFFITIYFSYDTASTLWLMTAIIPPLITPIVLLVLIWEMNIPRNISFYGVIGYFLIGGLLSFFIISFLFSVVPNITPSFAAFREEPAKLIVIMVILWFFGRNNKIYGLTGLVIGAAVGAGFGAFESVEYAMSSTDVYEMVINQVFRGVFALGGHTLYCAPYAAELALGMKEHKMTAKAFVRAPFLLSFVISCALHFLWNMSLGSFELWKDIAIIITLWLILLMTIRKCLKQIADIGLEAERKKEYEEHYKEVREISCREINSGYDRNHSVEKKNLKLIADEFEEDNLGKTMFETPIKEDAGKLVIMCIKGDLEGNEKTIKRGSEINVGRSPECEFRFPAKAKGVSRNHCIIRFSSEGCIITDLGSSYGTYINKENKIPAYETIGIKDKDVIYLGGGDNVLQVRLETVADYRD